MYGMVWYVWYGNPPQGNQELLVVRDKLEDELGVSKSVECDIFSSML